MPARKWRLNTVPKRQQQYILVDSITKLLVLRGYDSILVVCNRFSKILHFIITREKITVEELVKLFRNNVQKLYGFPESVILDKGPQFVAGLMKKLNKMLGIETKLLIAFYLQIDGQTERTN